MKMSKIFCLRLNGKRYYFNLLDNLGSRNGLSELSSRALMYLLDKIDVNKFTNTLVITKESCPLPLSRSFFSEPMELISLQGEHFEIPLFSFFQRDEFPTCTLQLNPALTSFFKALIQYSEKYDAISTMSFSSQYSVMVYQLLQERLSDDSTVRISIGDFRNYCNCDDTYSRVSGLKDKVITIALREINEKSPWDVDVIYETDGFRITYCIFKVNRHQK